MQKCRLKADSELTTGFADFQSWIHVYKRCGKRSKNSPSSTGAPPVLAYRKPPPLQVKPHFAASTWDSLIFQTCSSCVPVSSALFCWPHPSRLRLRFLRLKLHTPLVVRPYFTVMTLHASYILPNSSVQGDSISRRAGVPFTSSSRFSNFDANGGNAVAGDGGVAINGAPQPLSRIDHFTDERNLCRQR